MAVQNWTSLAVYVGGYNLACRAKTFDAPQVTVAQLDTTSLCDDGWTTSIGGIKSASWSANVMQDHDTDQVDDLVGLSALGVSTPLSIAPAGTTEGDVAYSFLTRQFNYSPSSSVDGLAMADLSGVGDGSPVVRGTLMNAPGTAVTTTGTTTGVQVGAVGATQSMYASLHVLSASGTSPTLDVVLESDDNSGFSSATTRATFAQAVGIGSEWTSAAGAITDDYWRLSYTVGGSTPSFTFAVVIGVATT